MGLKVPRQPNAGELPAVVGVEEVPVTGTAVPGGSGTGAAAQDLLIAHELAVVLAQGSRCCPVAGVGQVGALRPLPGGTKKLQGVERRRGCGSSRMQPGKVQALPGNGCMAGDALPLELRAEAGSAPAGKGIGFVVADMGHRKLR